MLPRLTPKQRQRANALIKRLCANYDNGNCLALDDGEPCACVQSISYSLLCKYFRKAVLPAEPLLEADILGTRFEKCVSCGAPIIKKGNRKKYCEKCAQRTYKAQQAEYARRKRVPFPVSWTVKMKKKQKETQDILSYHTQAAGCSDKARAKASGGRQPIEECGRTGL